MKNIRGILLIFSGLILSVACEKQDPVEMIQPKTQIIFDGNIDKRGGTYFVSGMVDIAVSVGSGVSSVNVISRYTRSGETTPKDVSLGTFPVASGIANFSRKAREIVDVADVQDDAVTLATGKIRPTGNFTLVFDAVLADGSTERKFFTATISNSIAFAAFSSNAPTVNPVNFFNDSTYSLKFTLQNPASARVTNVKIYRKLGGSVEEVVPIKDINYTETTATIDEHILNLAFPTQAGIPVYTGANYSSATAANRTLRHRVVVTTAVGEVNAFTAFNVAAIGVPLGFTRTLNFSRATGGLTRWDLGTRFNPVNNEVDADLVFSATGTGFVKTLDLGVGIGNTSDYVRLNSTFDYTNSTFNSIRDAYTAGTKVALVSNLVLGDILIINVGDIPDNLRATYKIIKVTSLQRDAVGSTDLLNIEYKSID